MEPVTSTSYIVLGTALFMLLNSAALAVYAERRVAAFIQNRVGPNRVGPLGLLQPIADVVKLILKEDVTPAQGYKTLHAIAPIIPVVTALMTAVVTSLPELVTTLAAVRRGALQLAVGGIIGGNTFDVLFLTLSDIGYREGSLYHAIGLADLFWVIVGLSMTAVLLLGLIRRERSGPANIGWESVVMLLIYGGAIGYQAWSG